MEARKVSKLDRIPKALFAELKGQAGQPQRAMTTDSIDNHFGEAWSVLFDLDKGLK